MEPVTGLALGRIAVGVTSLAAPDLTARVLGLDPAARTQTAYVARLFGAREIALGALTVAARGPALRALVLAGVAVDLADAATGVAGARQAAVSTRSAAALVAPAVGAVVVGVGWLRSGRS
ncbi:hypothetical protein [Nocardioides flavescens]|uniref:DUF4267 domain-containing protein n=1 Tax=Nocardioides flavescens TaxID=2691959 RepID=A0A6L7EQ96_9ACTN|nr:hypothetical protein [Nocardioides flavescens]MXG88770.1 hypothetical protein [Nocardioides flavescens]